MSDHLNEQMNALFRRAAGRGRFTVQEAETTPGSAVMNSILRGQPPAAAPEPEAEPEPYHNADAAEGRGQSLPREPVTMSDLLRGHHRAGRRERQSEAEAARLEREQSSEHRSW